MSVYYRNLTCFNRWQLYVSSKFNVSRRDKSSIPLKHGSRGLQCHYSPLKDIFCKLRYIVANILWINNQTISITIKYSPLSYRTGGNRKRSEQSMNAVHKSLKFVFSIAICRQSGDKRQSKTLFLTILDLRSSIVLTFSIAAYLKCLLNIYYWIHSQNNPKQGLLWII